MPEILRSFGRRRGRKLRTSRQALFDSLLPELLIDLSSAGSLQLATLFSNPDLPLWFEIGFGGGEHLLEQAKNHPGVNFIGCEPYVNGMAALLAAIESHKLTSIRLYDNDARELLERLPDNSVERLFVLFPDPWPKKRHHKKRIISQNSLALFYRKITMDGLLRIATDHEDYCTWMLENMLRFEKFEWQAKTCSDWQTPPSGWVATRYQAKALAEGRQAVFLDWVKR